MTALASLLHQPDCIVCAAGTEVALVTLAPMSFIVTLQAVPSAALEL